MKKIKTKIPVSKILLGVFSVSFAILLALVLNEWREKTANEKLAKESLVKIRKELSSNYDIVWNNLDKNRKIVENQKKAYLKIITKLENEPSHAAADLIQSEFPFSFMTETIKETAWNSANLTHAVEYLDFDIVELLSATYESQDSYSRWNEKVLERLSSPDLFKKETIKAELLSYFMLLEMYFQMSESLVEEYEVCLKEINPASVQ